jgi:hypothetical protein
VSTTLSAEEAAAPPADKRQRTPSDALVVLTDVERRLAGITTVAAAKDLRDQAEALRRYAQQSRAGKAAQDACARVRFLAERRAGILLLAAPRGGRGGRPTKTPSDGKGVSSTPTHGFWSVKRLAELGVKPHEAQRWQLLATFPLGRLNALFKRFQDDGLELTAFDVYHAARTWQHRQQHWHQDTSASSDDSAVSVTNAAGVAGREPRRDPSTYTDAELHGAGLPTAQSIERYRRATVKQITMFFNGEEYVEFVKRLQRVMKIAGARNHTEAVICALETWEKQQGLPPAPPRPCEACVSCLLVFAGAAS